MFRLLLLLVLACLFAEVVSLNLIGQVKTRRRDRQRFPPLDLGANRPKLNVRLEEETEFFQLCTFTSLETAEQVWDRFKGLEEVYLFQDRLTRTYYALTRADQISMGNVSLPPDSLNSAQMLPLLSLLGLVDPEKSRERTGEVNFGDGLLTILKRTFPIRQSLNNEQFDALMERVLQLYAEFADLRSTTAYFIAQYQIPAEFIYLTNAKSQEVLGFEKKLDGVLGGQGSSKLDSARVFKIHDPRPRLRPWSL